MNTLQLDYDEGIILENEDVYWASRDDLELTNFTLTNKNLYCTYEKDNGFFKKSTSEMCVLALSDIKIINGQALVQQVKYEGSWCIQIQFRQGVEYFSFSSSPKKVIPQWIAEINRLLIGSPEQIIESPVEIKKKSSAFGGLGGITANLKSVADSAAQAVTSTVKQASETINHHSGSDEEPTYSHVPKVVSPSEPQHQGAKFCSNCGTPINVGAKFCHGCGTPIGTSNVPTPPPVPQPAPPVPSFTEQEQPKRAERRQQEFVGTVLKCPNCGAIIGETTAVCPDCGIRITGRSAVTSVQSFKEQLMAIEVTRKKGLGGVFGVYTAPDPADTKKLSLIRSFPIPNSVDDIMEFMFLAVANIDVSLSKNTAMNKWNSTQQVETGATIGKTISNAWVAKTLRYYAEIGLLEPSEVNPENGYRYYAIEQLEKMLFINRLKAYSFSLEEIKAILQSEEIQDDKLYLAFIHKKKEIEKQVHNYSQILTQLEDDISAIEQGKSIMSYMEEIDVQLVDVPKMYLLSIRKMVQAEDYPTEYIKCYEKLFKRIAVDKLTMSGAPMVLFHSAEYSPSGLDTEFAIPVQEYVTGTRDFCPGLCLKTVVRGEYSELSSVYARQIEWAEKEGYRCTNALFEAYVTDPSQVADVKDNITEVYYPVKKITSKD